MKRPTLYDDVKHTFNHEPEYLIERFVLEVHGTIRRRMKSAGITQKELAEKLGVTPARVSRMLNDNRNVTLASMAMIADALGAKWSGLTLKPIEENKKAFARLNVTGKTAAKA
jgi:transcriptional regulator with XRE-family HTH domain